MLAAGRMDQRVTLQSKSVTRDAVGAAVETWADDVTVWASVRDLRARETMTAQQVGNAVSRIVHIRWRTGVSADQRLKFDDNRIGRIAAVSELGRKETLELQVEVVNG